MTDRPDPVPPLLVAEGWDLSFFRSQASLGREIEPWFPGTVDYRAWDSHGRRLELVVEPTSQPPRRLHRPRSPDARVTARIASDQAQSSDDLRAYLNDWLNQINAHEAPPDADLSALLLHAIVHGDLR